MHASLAFLNGAGARSGTPGRQNAFLEVLNLLCTTHRPLRLAGQRARAQRLLRRSRTANAGPTCVNIRINQ